MPVWSGLTVGAPLTTWSQIPSFGYGVAGSCPKTRAAFVSFSQKSGSGVAGRREPARAEVVVLGADRARRRAAATARGKASPHDHVLRNQSVGRTSIVAASGPALRTEMRTSTSSGEAFA